MQKRSVYQGLALLLMRILIAVIFVYHGAEKALAPSQAMHNFSNLGLPGFMGPVMGWLEIVVGIFLFVGHWTKWCSIAVVAIMVGAIVTVQAPAAANAGKWLVAGLERDLLILVGAIGLFVQGPGMLSSD